MFAKELEAAEVREMKEGGMCSEVEEKYGRGRYLKWEDLLLEERTGNVTEIDVGCNSEVRKEEEGEGEEEEEERGSAVDCDCEQGNKTAFCHWDLPRGEKL